MGRTLCVYNYLHFYFLFLSTTLFPLFLTPFYAFSRVNYCPILRCFLLYLLPLILISLTIVVLLLVYLLVSCSYCMHTQVYPFTQSIPQSNPAHACSSITCSPLDNLDCNTKNYRLYIINKSAFFPITPNHHYYSYPHYPSTTFFRFRAASSGPRHSHV